MKINEKISNKLNDLLIKNYDAEKGYREAIENADSNWMKSYFSDRVTERKRFISELKAEIINLGKDPKDSGSLSGSMHRGWMDFKTIFTKKDDEAIIEEVLKGEKSSLEEYNDFLKEPEIPSDLKKTAIKQRDTVKQAIHTLNEREAVVS
ncbi:ferritin-like domain-containing protein [Aegicerativicinus sediminis]|uniref:ferritin-like domain-containing protein n=1 Tax=Aegicerativicinus sediminis TaxID=2893202 RepID=UPI001E317C59|nr:PA2169 family four-helix-bundle protein [Aegicerativicinus sediminis]